MKIGVSGASGYLGKEVVSELVQRAEGHEIVAISRTPDNVPAPVQGRFGDYDRPESLAKAYSGLDRLLITGKPIAFRVITEEQLRGALTKANLPPGAVNIVVSIQASFASGVFDILTGDVERLGGRPPKTLREVLAVALKPAGG